LHALTVNFVYACDIDDGTCVANLYPEPRIFPWFPPEACGWGRIYPNSTTSQSLANRLASPLGVALMVPLLSNMPQKISPRQQLHSFPLLLVEITD
jgi:hypothetical protein